MYVNLSHLYHVNCGFTKGEPGQLIFRNVEATVLSHLNHPLLQMPLYHTKKALQYNIQNNRSEPILLLVFTYTQQPVALQ